MSLLEEVAEPHGVADGFVVGERAGAQAFFQRWAFDQFHRDEEVFVIGAELEHFRHAAVQRAEALLQRGAAAFGGDGVGAVLAAAQDQLERGQATVMASTRAEHGAELAAADRLFFDDLEVVTSHQRAVPGV